MNIVEPFANGNSPVHRLDPRVKIVTAALFSVVVALNYEPAVLFVALASILALLFAARLCLKKVLKRLLLANGFILVLWFFLPFTTPGTTAFTVFGIGATFEGLGYAALITIKSNTILITCMVLLSTCPILDLLYALHHLHVPDKVVHLFFFSYRYLYVINQEYIRLTNAMKVRCFKPGHNLHTWRSLAYLVGMLILKSSERSRRIYSAMLCRGFKGKFYVSEHRVFRKSDLAFIVFSVFFIGLLVVI